MEVKLQFTVFMLLIQVSLGVWQHITVMKGQTLTLRCPITDAHKTHVDWKNPEGYIMFFNDNQALNDKRYSINKLSETEFSISISNVNFKDGGNYTCTHYNHHTTEKKVEVTVLGHPQMSVVRHEGQIVVKCTAAGNHLPPQISWKFDHGHEFLAHANVQLEDKKYVSTGMLHFLSVERRVTVRCLVRHPSLYSQHLMNFVNIGRDSKRSRLTTTTRLPTVKPRGSTEGLGIRTSSNGGAAMYFTTTDMNRLSSESSAVPSSQRFSSDAPKTMSAITSFPLKPVTSTGPHQNTIGDSRTSEFSGSTKMNNDTASEATSTTGWTSEVTEDITSNNYTERNKTGNFELNVEEGTHGSASLLVFLVSCLIFGLLVVVTFFAIKLRRAHVTWRKENEDFDQSEESSKSKSSQEEKSAQVQRRRGVLNTEFTQYVVEETTGTTSVINTAALAAKANEEQTCQLPASAQTLAISDIKETEL
ncbi:cytotoxic and regulatory T-cell molecule [Embiotoca jacksoni]|uniref:cytotoxic and regulatory T-cell molecule n=1 Tax=Embiotoca jacksoni TaxID=100190 RepID=UPI003704A1F2